MSVGHSTREQLSAYLDGELDARERAALESRLAAEPEAARELARLQVLDAALAELPSIEPSPQFEMRFRARLAEAQARRARPWWQRWLPHIEAPRLAWGAGALAAAAAVVLLLLRSADTGPAPGLDWEIVADGQAYELLQTDDLELLEVLEILEAWDGSTEI
jgi:anti-sigma factor RsiW